MTVEVVFERGSLRPASAKNATVTGHIRLEVGESVFPHRDWIDFPCVVLGWWILLIRSREDGQLLFMDGPHSVEIEWTPADDCTLRYLLNGVAHVAQVEGAQLDEALNSAAEALVAYCQANDLDSAGLDRLV